MYGRHDKFNVPSKRRRESLQNFFLHHTGCVLDGPGIESPWGRDFPHLSRPVPEATQPPVQWVPGLSRWQRAVGE